MKPLPNPVLIARQVSRVLLTITAVGIELVRVAIPIIKTLKGRNARGRKY
jgi:hypothetical protein